jgi:hypothetical protein
MAIAALYNVPSTKSELDSWTFYHMLHHRDVNASILRLTGVRIDEYILDPVSPQDPGDWEYQHQLMHQAVNNVLGFGGGLDLSDVTWTDPNKLSGWIFSNGIEHRQWADLLGVD